jgi:hypothetical protein
MGKKMYVGNLSYDVQNSDLEQLFGQHGTVQSADVIMDRDSGQSKGFGFVEMSSDAEAEAAIAALNGYDYQGRSLKIAVMDVSEGGARIAVVEHLAVGDKVALAFAGIKEIAGEVVRRADDGFGVCFTPARLRPEELRDLVTAPEQAA